MRKTTIILFCLVLSLLFIPIVYAVEPVKIGTMATKLNWVFAQATCGGIYYGLGWNETIPDDHIPAHYSRDIYYFNFTTKENKLVTTLSDRWQDSLYKSLIGDKLFMSPLCYYPFISPNFCDPSGIYIFDLKTNTFSLLVRSGGRV